MPHIITQANSEIVCASSQQVLDHLVAMHTRVDTLSSSEHVWTQNTCAALGTVLDRESARWLAVDARQYLAHERPASAADGSTAIVSAASSASAFFFACASYPVAVSPQYPAPCDRSPYANRHFWRSLLLPMLPMPWLGVSASPRPLVGEPQGFGPRHVAHSSRGGGWMSCRWHGMGQPRSSSRAPGSAGLDRQRSTCEPLTRLDSTRLDVTRRESL